MYTEFYAWTKNVENTRKTSYMSLSKVCLSLHRFSKHL